MNNMWAPWRMEYIKGEKASSCIFCTSPKGKDDLILTKGKLSYAIMNRFPYTAGHTLVAPYRHVGDLVDLSSDESSEIMSMTNIIITAVRLAMKAQGFNVGYNIGKTAGAGIAEHLHLHIVPRWDGDINFMPVLSDVHIISEHIEQTRDKIKRYIP
jgi:ATP adenylyltransferase